jgi:hypothetical protein
LRNLFASMQVTFLGYDFGLACFHKTEVMYR